MTDKRVIIDETALKIGMALMFLLGGFFGFAFGLLVVLL